MEPTIEEQEEFVEVDTVLKEEIKDISLEASVGGAGIDSSWLWYLILLAILIAILVFRKLTKNRDNN